MQPRLGLVWGFTLSALAAMANPAHAGWNNVFQVCCNNCGGPAAAPAVANYGGDPCCAPPPTTTCTTRYIQRTYYQPVVTYKQSTYYQPVTSYRTSYFYEPVCSYRYSCYYDPCTCSYQQVATPVTSYRLRSQCCPVTSYLQRTCCTPVTSYRAMCYYEPVTTCCQTSNGPAVNGPAVQAQADATPAPPAPNAEESFDRNPPFPSVPPGVRENKTSDINPPDKMPPIGGPTRRTNPAPQKAPALRLDHFASGGDRSVTGRMVDGDRRAMAEAKVLFVSVERKTNQQTATTDRDGNFRADLSEGAWLVYTYDNDGKPAFSRRVEVPAGRTVQLTLVNR